MEGLDDDFVVALILKKALDLKEFRQLLRLRRTPRGPSFCIDDLVDIPAGKDAALRVAKRFSSGEITRENALSDLETMVADFYGQHPKDGKTIEKLLKDLVQRADWIDKTIHDFLDHVAHGDRENAELLAKNLLGK